MLVMWWWKLETGDGLWQRIVRGRYFRNKTVANIRSRFSDSPSWKSIMKVKDVYIAGRKVNINKGDLARVWHDPWVDNGILREHFPVLYDICQDQDCTIASFVDNDYNLPFRRRLFGELEEQWNWMVCEAKKMPLNENPDAISWSLNSGGRFTTKSVYK